MRIRIGDLVTVKDKYDPSKRGLVISTHGFYLCYSTIDVRFKHASTSTVVSRKNIIRVVPREQVKEYWKFI